MAPINIIILDIILSPNDISSTPKAQTAKERLVRSFVKKKHTSPIIRSSSDEIIDLDLFTKISFNLFGTFVMYLL